MQFKWEEWHVDWVDPRRNLIVVPKRVELISEIAFGTLKWTSILIDFSRLNLKVEYATLFGGQMTSGGWDAKFLS